MNKSLKVIALIAAIVSVVSMVPLEAKRRRGGCRNGMCGVRVAQVIPVVPADVRTIAPIEVNDLVGTIGGNMQRNYDATESFKAGSAFSADSFEIRRGHNFVNAYLTNEHNSFPIIVSDSNSFPIVVPNSQVTYLEIHFNSGYVSKDDYSCVIEFGYFNGGIQVQKFEFRIASDELDYLGSYKALLETNGAVAVKDIFTSIDRGSAHRYMRNIVHLVNVILENNGYESPRLMFV